MMNILEYDIDDVVEMKKEHPCASRSKQWQILRLGADIKIRCMGCGAIVMLSRYHFNKNLKKVITKATK